MINLRHLEVFHAVMITGTLTGAARMLHVSQPAISSVIKHFESRIKIKLFEKVQGRLIPTPEATALMPEVDDIFGRINTLERFAQDLSDGFKGVLSIAATSPLANGLLAYAVASFLRKRQDIKIVLQSTDSQVVVERLLKRQVDVGVAFEPIRNEALEYEILTVTNVSCVLPIDHPLAKFDAITPEQLLPYPIITYLPQALLRPYVNKYLVGKDFNITVEIGVSVTGIMLALHGAGIALVEPNLLSVMAIPNLVVKPLVPTVQIRSYLIVPGFSPKSKALKDFITHLRNLPERLEGN